jgi:hypothetical protein
MYELIHSREEQGTTTAAAAAGNSIRFSRVKMNEKKEEEDLIPGHDTKIYKASSSFFMYTI